MRAAGLALLLLAAPAAAATVHSLDQIPARLHSPEAKSDFAQQIEGKPAPDLLGTRNLPPGLTAADIARLLVPAGDHGKPGPVGARHWQGDLYVAIACTAADPSGPACAGLDRDHPPRAYLGLIALAPNAAPRLVAASGAWNPAMDWSATNLPDTPGDGDPGAQIPQSFDAFDLAPYRIAPGQPAFGLRASWSDSYSGGGALYTGLYLFAQDGTALRPVLAAPMSVYKNVAGDWHKDGTRDHSITDIANLLVVSAHRTAGHDDLELRQRHGRGRQLWRWSPADRAYRAVGR